MHWFLSAALAATWPAPDAPVTRTDVEFPPDFGVHTVFLDAGHGAPNNQGNTGASCAKEADFTKRVTDDLAVRLEATGHFEVVRSRPSDALVPYADRLEAATASGAAAFLSIHSDIRVPDGWVESPAVPCYQSDHGPGFTVLWSDEGDLADARHQLAIALGDRLTDMGLPAYRGEDYDGKYAEDPDHPGVMVDRHEPSKRIAFLRRPTMPSVIVETHHAWVLEEAKRWEEQRVLDAFGAAVAAALVEWISAQPRGNRTPQ